MTFPIIKYSPSQALDLTDFRDMDYYTLNNYNLPIELMMENAGLQLANLVASFAEKSQSIKVGIGNGNNGGGGLVAARRLAAWGYPVYLDISTKIARELPALQLKRALKFGARIGEIANPDVWVDAYLGFSQRLPLNSKLLKTIEEANKRLAIKVSLDIPTGFLGNINSPYFQSDKVLTLAAPKKILYKLMTKSEIYVADLGIPAEVYSKFGVEIPPFHLGNIIEIKP